MDAGGDGHSHWCPTRRERRVTYGRSCVLDPFLLEEDDPHPPGEGFNRYGRQGMVDSRQSVDFAPIMPAGQVYSHILDLADLRGGHCRRWGVARGICVALNRCAVGN
jgi:hypothetical protein